MASRVIEIKVTDGGALSASLSHENIGPENYVDKTNWRREKDQEIRREGWVIFKPDAEGPDTQDDFDATDTVIKLAELVAPDGERALIGASRTEIKRFNYDTGVWDIIGSGYSASGKRWQAVTMNGYLVLNNTVNLPTTYRLDDPSNFVSPMYSLRERGVAAVGRMEQSNGFILFADITEIQADQLEPWMNGYSTAYPVTFTQPLVGDHIVISPGESGWQFTMDNTLTSMITLPAAPAYGFYFWLSYSAYDSGSPDVVVDPTLEGTQPILDSITSLVLIRWDFTLQRWVATNFPTGVLPANDPYGPVVTLNPAITNRFPWRVINGEFADPRNWATIVDVRMSAASNGIELPFVPIGWIAGQTRVAVINGGPDGGVLGGQAAYPNGILIIGFGGNTVVLETTTDVSISYPRTVSVTRWSDLSTLSASYDLQDDGSQIHGLMVLQNLIMVYRKTGIYVGRYTGISVDSQGNTTGPFNFTPHYRGFNIPMWGDCIANVNGQYHLYPAEGSRWYKFDGNTNPEVHPQTDLARNIFFDLIDEEEYEPWAVESPLTKEWWFFRDGLVFAYDFEYNTVSVIDAQIDSAVFCLRPESTDRWFVLGIENLIVVYGLVTGIIPINTWTRSGEAVTATLKSGLISLGNQFDEKTLLSFVPVMATDSPDMTWEVQLYAALNPSVTPVALLSTPEVLPTPENENLIACFFQSIYFQFRIQITDILDLDARYSSSLMEIERVNAGRVTTRVNQ